jgi:hypothetical protein
MENPIAAKEMVLKYVMRLTDKSEKPARAMITHAKNELGKGEIQKLSISEFCQFYGYDENKVCRLLDVR